MPPLVIHPDSSVHLVVGGHLGLGGCPPAACQAQAGEQEEHQDAACCDRSTASGSWHGRTLLVSGAEAAFARVSVHPVLEPCSEDAPSHGGAAMPPPAAAAAEAEEAAAVEAAAAARHRLDAELLAAEAAACKGGA